MFRPKDPGRLREGRFAMFLYRGGTHVNRGHYWTPSNGSWVDGRSERRLPGGRETVYLRLHPVAMFLLAPVVGLTFFLTMPLATLVLAAAAVLVRIGRAFVQTVGSLAYFEWQPNEAYLAGKRHHNRERGNGHQESH
jgi:hypothetical protein